MALKAKLSKDEHAKLDEALKALYVEKAGAFMLQVDGMVSQEDYDATESKLAEFRDTNVRLMKDAKKFEGVDPEEYRTLKATNEKLTKQGVKSADDIQTLVATEVAKALKGTDDRIKAIETERDQARTQLSEKSLEDALWDVGSKSIKESARRDFLGRAKEVFKFEDGKIVARNGETQIFSKKRGNTTAPLSIEEFVTDPEWLMKDADHLYKSSNGSGTRKSDDTTQNGVRVVENDPSVLGMNLEAMAKGHVAVNAG